jgi:hypothetical protein
MGTLTVLVDEQEDAGPVAPISERATAFEVWLTSGRPKIAELARILKDDPHSLDIPYSTLTYWYRTDQWDVEADRRIAQLAPNLTVRSAAHVVAAGVKAAAYVDQVWSGALPYDRDKMTSALQTLDRAGFGANVKERPTPSLPTTTSQDDGPRDTSPSAAAERIRRRREGWREGE